MIETITFRMVLEVIAGVYLIWMQTLWTTHTTWASLKLKVVPLLIGVILIVYALIPLLIRLQ